MMASAMLFIIKNEHTRKKKIIGDTITKNMLTFAN